MKKLLMISVLVLLAGMGTLKAQNYNTAIGIRGGLYNGITLKHFTGGNKALEGILVTRWNAFNFTGLLEFDNSIADVDGLSWLYGIGAHIGNYDNVDKVDYTVIGVDLILGLEFTIPNAPICFQLDYKPVMNLVGTSGFVGDGGALSIRYAF